MDLQQLLKKLNKLEQQESHRPEEFKAKGKTLVATGTGSTEGASPVVTGTGSTKGTTVEVEGVSLTAMGSILSKGASPVLTGGGGGRSCECASLVLYDGSIPLGPLSPAGQFWNQKKNKFHINCGSQADQSEVTQGKQFLAH